MILRGWHIEGFGTWRDFRVEDLGEGLNVLEGPNEVGKSTLHAFVRGVLYGYPDKRSREPMHEPLHGGTHGGRLFLETGAGLLDVARWGRNRRTVVIEGPGGERIDGARLQGLLRGVDGQVFRNVFAFGLDELAGLGELSAEEVGLRIFDAGLEGAGQSVAALVEELRARQEAEHKSRGGRLRELAGQVLEAKRVHAAAVERARGHGALLLHEAAGERALLEARGCLALVRREQAGLEKLLALWPLELRRRQVDPKWRQGWEGVAARMGQLLAEGELQRDRLRRIEELRRQVSSARHEVGEAVARLGPGWDEARLGRVDRSAQRQARLVEAAGAQERAEREVAAAEGTRERAAAEEARLVAERDVAAAALAALGPVSPAEELREGRAALAELRAAVADREALLRRQEELRDRSAGGAVPRLAGAVAGIFAIVCLGTLAAGSPAAAAVALLAAVAAGLLALRARRAGEGARLAGIEAALAAASERIDVAAGTLGLGGAVGAAAIERCAADLGDAERLALRREAAVQQLEAVALRLAGARAAREAAEAGLAAARAAFERRVVAGEREVADLAPCPSPRAGLELLQRIERCGEMLDGCRRDEAALAALDEAASRWDGAVAGLLAEAGIAERGAAGLSLLEGEVRAARAAHEAEVQIGEQLGADEEAARLRAELAAGERTSWEEAREAVEQRAAALDAEMAELVEALALQRNAREELERSADVPAAAAALAAAEVEFEGAVRRYREAALLERLLREALERFQQERQPEVLLHASADFRRITGGRYVAVRQPVGVKEVEVVDAAGRVVPAGALSRGAREQLYICIRLGLVRAFAASGQRLPLLLDDVLVNFDPARARATAEVIADFAREHQVLLFTCHPQTARMLAEVDPGVREVPLGGAVQAEVPRVA